MSRFLLPFILTLMAMTGTLCSCQNDEYIGDFYGQWQLTDIQTSDTTASPRDLFFAFQSNVVWVRIASVDAHYTGGFKGTWQENGDSLFFSFYYDEIQTDNIRSELRHRMAMPGTIEDLRFGLRIDSRHMTLTRGADSWHFRKY